MDPGKCEACGEVATVHLCEISDNEKSEHHYCQKHAGVAELPGFDLDAQVREAISMCRMMLPRSKQSSENVAAEFRRLVDRALTDMTEDAKAFGFEG